MENLKDRVAIVTGAGRGAGRVTSLELARAGARLVLVSRTESEINSLAEEIRALGGQALPVPTDITMEAQVQRMKERALDQFGTVDILVNNAGIAYWGPVETTPLEEWNQVMGVNLTGMFLCSRAVIGPMKQQRSGHIINISSGAGKQGYADLAAYCASKFGVIGFSESLSAELMPWNIKVSTLVPGSIETTFSARSGRRRNTGDAVRLLRAEDVAQAIIFLLTQSERGWTQEMNLWPFKERQL